MKSPHPTRPPTSAVVRYTAGAVSTRSELEERLLAPCDRHALPRPDVNRLIEGYEVDFVWRDARLIVEVDGYAHHRSPRAFEDDRSGNSPALGDFAATCAVKAPESAASTTDSRWAARTL